MRCIAIAGISGGIGQALARQMLARDPELVILGLCRDPKQAAASDGLGDRVHRLAWSAESGLQEDLPEGLALEGIVYCAGILHGEGMTPEKRLEDLKDAAFLQAMQVNALGFARLVQALMPALRHKRLKHLVAISAKVGSISDNGMGGWYSYRASKAALNMLVRNLAIELPRRCRPVCCVALHPGTTETALSAPFQQSLARLEVHTTDETAENLLAVMDTLQEKDNGRFLSWDGSELPW